MEPKAKTWIVGLGYTLSASATGYPTSGSEDLASVPSDPVSGIHEKSLRLRPEALFATQRGSWCFSNGLSCQWMTSTLLGV